MSTQAATSPLSPAPGLSATANAYLALFRARMRMLLQYRTAAIAGLGTQLFWGLIKIMIMEAFYRNATASSAAPMPLSQVITYTWLGQALFAMLPYSANPDPEVREMIRSGAVAYEFARPLDLYNLWYVRSLASRLAPTLLRVGPQIFCALLFFGMQPPASLAAFGAWLVATACALLLVSAFSTLITVTLLWTVSGDGIARLAPSLVFICSGMVIPLPLYPAWAQPILNFLPFRGMADAPFRLFLGNLPPSAAPGIVAQQLIWTALFVVAGRQLLARGTRRLIVQGG